MSIEVIQEKRPTYSAIAMVVIIILAAALFGIGVAFAYLLISGKGNNYQLGTLLAF
jgi:Sec-independent protein secretion pathway component TatC